MLEGAEGISTPASASIRHNLDANRAGLSSISLNQLLNALQSLKYFLFFIYLSMSDCAYSFLINI
jgi:hypothetical protein